MFLKTVEYHLNLLLHSRRSLKDEDFISAMKAGTFTITSRKGILLFQKKEKKAKDISVFQMK